MKQFTNVPILTRAELKLLPLDKGRWSALHDLLVQLVPEERTGGFEDAGSFIAIS